jgi:hypothetical protein
MSAIFFSWELPFSEGKPLRARTVFLVTSLVIAYFLGLTYAVLRAGTYFGIEVYALLLLTAVVFGILAIRYKTRLGTSFLIFFNACQIFVLCVLAAYLLNTLGIARISLNNVDFFAAWNLTFGLFVVLNILRYFGFRDRTLKYYFFYWTNEARKVPGTN